MQTRIAHYRSLFKFHWGRFLFRANGVVFRIRYFKFGLFQNYWMKLGLYFHYAPRPFVAEKFPQPDMPDAELPGMAIVTPSFNQAQYLWKTIESVVSAGYPRLSYAVMDGGSTDGSPEIIERYRSRLAYAVSQRDGGQSAATIEGFRHVEGDIMAYLNSDDVLMPGALRYIGEYFAKHPDVDVIYGHRVIIDSNDQEVGRWILPGHSAESTLRFDFIPQETMFWRRRLYDAVGGLDGSFRFAMDWDIILRFIRAGARFKRLPYFLASFRVHEAQKSQAIIETVGKAECRKLMIRELGDDESRWDVERHHQKYCRNAILHALLMERGIRL